MAVHNSEIAEMFREMADLLELEDANRFRVRAYRQAATTVEELGRSVADMVANDEDLSELTGIGDDLAGKIEEILKSGSFDELDEMRAHSTPSLRELTHVPQIGPKRAKQLYEQLGIRNLDDLEAAAEDGRLQQIRGIGKKATEQIKNALETGRMKKERRLLLDVEEIARSLEEFICSYEGVQQCCVAGSFRRRKETVGDLDIVAATDSPAALMNHFVAYGDIADVISKGNERSSVVLRSGLQVDLRIVESKSYGAALIYFTGAKEHQLQLRDMAIDRDQKLNEYGLFDKNDKQLAGKTEEEVYAAFDLPWIEPELRENHGEIDAAASGELPDLITLDDIRGDLHCHTIWSDGRAGIKEMAEAAKAKGYDYVAITDHSKRMRMVNGLNEDDLRKQAEEIKQVNDEINGLSLLAGIEVDILEDGSLDLSDEALGDLDIVICSIHSKLDLSSEKQTERLLRTVENPHCQILGHLTGRRVLERDPMRMNLERVLTAAGEAGCAIELNADPHRLDLYDTAAIYARELGLTFTIGTDAHSVPMLDYMHYGVSLARRAWLESPDVLNSRTLSNLRKGLRSS